MIHVTIGRGMMCGDVTTNSFAFSCESYWHIVLNLNELPIENSLNKIIKIVLHVSCDVLAGF